jgi:tetratricopeptide (TPR) repeat protein
MIDPDRIQQDVLELARGRMGWAQALGIPPQDVVGMAKAASAEMTRRRYAEAERLYFALTQMDPSFPFFWLSLAEARSKRHKPAEAIEAYERCLEESLKKSPPAKEALAASYGCGVLQARCGEVERALESFRQAVRLDPDGASHGRRARLSIQALTEGGKLPKTQEAQA